MASRKVKGVLVFFSLMLLLVFNHLPSYDTRPPVSSIVDWSHLAPAQSLLNGNCRLSDITPSLICDHFGRVCPVRSLTPDKCCPQSKSQYNCTSCREDHCCELYENCVSCCLSPAHKELVHASLSFVPYRHVSCTCLFLLL